jgi:PhzF family phenazine biosynthesis protein
MLPKTTITLPPRGRDAAGGDCSAARRLGYHAARGDRPMQIPLYQVDAFTDRVFGGNPAAVCPLEEWPDDALLQAIARENNLSETAFFVREGQDRYALRWFTPTLEVDLCGHATLASAFVLWDRLGAQAESLRFATRSGELTVDRRADLIVLSLPSAPPREQPAPAAVLEGLVLPPAEVLYARESEGQGNWLAVYHDEEAVRALAPRFDALARLDREGVIATAPGRDVDFVSRYFCPAFGIDEDPVTGSAHCTSVPYWARRLGRPRLRARQISARGGELICEDRAQRVEVAGRAALYLEGTIHV